MDKTIKTLNEKWWYRLLKVIYIVLLIMFVFSAITLSFSSYSPKKIYDNEKSFIVCDDGREFSLEENNVYLGISGRISTSDDKKFNSWCLDGSEEKVENVDGRIARLKKSLATNKVEKEKNYIFFSSYKIIGDWNNVMLSIFFSMLTIFAVFELFRRIFYYVILGKMKPKKN